MGPSFDVAIIGGGYAGTMLAVSLQQTLPSTARIVVLGRDPVFACGVAYVQTDVAYLLNVCASKMSAFANDPEHFVRWLADNSAGHEAEISASEAGVFVSRRFYGCYLQDVLKAAQGQTDKAQIDLFVGDVARIEPSAEGWFLYGPQGERLEAGSVVLACGNLPVRGGQTGKIFPNPWLPQAVRDVTPDAPILVVGTGLTMTDLLLGLAQEGFTGQVIALSRHGLVPQPHVAVPTPWPTPRFSAAERGAMRLLMRAVRAQVKLAASQGVAWQAVIDSLRPMTADLWQGLPQAEQSRFLRHVRSYWDTHRHRLAPVMAEMVAQKRAKRELRIMQGTVVGIKSTTAKEVQVEVLNRITGKTEILSVQRVIYATGVSSALKREPVLSSLLTEGLACADALDIALDVDPSLAVRGHDGAVVPNLWALGPLVRGVFWESIAVPDIRDQIQHLSGAIAKSGLDAVGEGSSRFPPPEDA